MELSRHPTGLRRAAKTRLDATVVGSED